DGERHAGCHFERVVAAGGRGRCGRARGPLRPERNRRRHLPRADRRRAPAQPARSRDRARAAILLGSLGPARPRHLQRGEPLLMPPRVALVHDWLTGMRGGEKALEVLCERFPDAELFTLVHVRGSVSPTIERLRPHTSFVQRLPFVKRWYRQYLPLFPIAVEQF